MMIIQQIHNDCWRISDKKNMRIAGISKINRWYVVIMPNGGFSGKFESLHDAVNSIKRNDN